MPLRSFWILLSVVALSGCRDESVAGPFGLRLRERGGGGSVAGAIRREALKHPGCPAVELPSEGWTVRIVSKPAGRVSLPPRLEAVSAPTDEVTFLAADMTAGAIVLTAPSLASIEVPEDSTHVRGTITSCRVQAGAVEGVLHLYSQPFPPRAGDSVHLGFLQFVAPGEQAVRAGAFATTRELRDSLLGALLAFQPDRK